MGALCNHSLELTGLAGDPASRVHRLDPRAKLLGLVSVTFVAVSTPLSGLAGVCRLPAILAAVAMLGAQCRRATIWRRARFILPLVLFAAVFLPFVRKGGRSTRSARSPPTQDGLETFAAVVAQGDDRHAQRGAARRHHDLSRRCCAASRRCASPRLLVLIAAFMYRYLFVIVEEAGRMRAALAARAYRPRNALQAAALGRLATALFLRTYSRGERVYLAMLARGYDGPHAAAHAAALHRGDVVFVGARAGGPPALAGGGGGGRDELRDPRLRS